MNDNKQKREIHLDVDDLMNNPHSTIMLHHPLTGQMWKGIITDDISCGTSADFGSPFENYMQGASDKLNAIGSASNAALGTDFQGTQMKNLTMTIAQWSGSAKPSWNLNFTFIKLHPDSPDPVTLANSLEAMCLPEATGVGGMLQAPGGYVGKIEGAEGTFMLQIGSYFRVPQCVLKSASSNITKTVYRNGRPLRAVVSVSLEYYRMVTATEYKNFILKT